LAEVRNRALQDMLGLLLFMMVGFFGLGLSEQIVNVYHL
jgi:hypothetical protein